ncbi:MAG: ABC transporter permease, partial [Gemmatimonadota bacterium]
YPEGVGLWLRNPEEAPGIPGFAGEITQLRTAWYFDVVGRLAPGTTLSAAQSELDAIAAALRDEHPDENEDAGVMASPLRETIVGESRPLLLLLLSAVGLVLLAACANVANLSLVRAEGRRRDFAVRAALGAEGGRLLRFVLTEGLVLALAGGALGASLAFLALPGLRALLPPSLPRRDAIALDGTVLLFTIGASLLACTIFAAAPALLARRTAPARALAGRAGDESGRAGAWLRAGLVVVEVALGVVLSAGTGLVIRSLSAMAHVEPGFRAEGLATARVSFPDALTMSEAERTLRWSRVREAVASLPGVSEAGVGIASPVERGPQAGLNVVRDDVSGIDAERNVVWHPASPGYLEALGVRLVRGRTILPTDRADGVPVAVVTEGLADRFFPGEDAIGRLVTIGLDEGHDVRIEIVGIVADTRNRGPVVAPTPILYRPLAQAGDFGGSALTVAAYGPGGARALVREIADAVHRVEPVAVVYDESLGTDLGARFFAQHRFIFRLLGLFATLAVVLAAIGIYGVTAHSISRRRRELGIRMAIGATRERVLASVFGGGLRLTAGGVAVGIVLALSGGRLLTSFLFNVRPADPLTLGGVSLLLLAVAALALALPARQAVHVDPAESMRGQ